MHKAMGLIFGNIQEQEIPEITAYRTLGSVPFFGRYRLIDFTLSNMANSGITKTGIITKTNYQSLMGHVGSGKQWDMSRKNGGLMVLPPFGSVASGGTYNSRYEALTYNLSFVKQADEEYLVMTDCDAVCNFDFESAIAYHIDNGADITLIYRKKDLGQSDAKLRTVITQENGKISKMEMSDKLKGIHNVYTNMLIIGRTFLLNVIDKMPKGKRSFTQDILIDGVNKFKIYAYELKGYFASIDSVSNYYKHSLELLDAQKRDMLFDNNGAKIYTKVHGSPPCKFGADANVVNSVIADGCVIEGEVKNSVLFRGVKVSKGAQITNSIVFQNTFVGRGSRLNCIIADKNCKILEDRLLSGHCTHPYYLTKGSTI